MSRAWAGLQLFGLILMLAGCAASESNQADMRERINRDLDQQRSTFGQVTTQDVAEPVPFLEMRRELYVPPIQAGSRLPSWTTLNVEVAFEDYPLVRLLQDIASPLGISVRWLDQIDNQQTISLAHRGNLGEFLRKISDHTGLYYQLGENFVSWHRFETAEFDIAFLAGSTNYFLGDDGRSSNQGSMGGGQMVAHTISNQSQQYLNFSGTDLSVWGDVSAALAMLVSPDGSWSLNQASTSVLVRDLPHHVELVRNYLQQLNRRLTRQVAIEIQVVDIVFNDSRQVGVDWDLVYRMTSGSGVINFAGQSLANQAQGGVAASYQRLSGPMAGSELLLQALSQQGTVQVTKHPRLVTLNNQIAQIQIEENVTYLASAGTSSTANVGSTDILIPGVVTTGFELYVMPKLSDNQVLLQLSTTLSDLTGIEQIRSGDSLIQTPQTSRKKFFMKAMVAHEETLLITGLQNSKTELNQRQGLLGQLFGGREEQSRLQSETLILMTPVILN